MKISPKERFEKKIKITDSCWTWEGRKHRQGYGLFFYNGKTRYAHRVSYELYIGEIPKGEGFHGTCVLHKCDNTSCVNPSHLFLGTHKDNMIDKELKGRGGQTGHPRKLSDEDILRIKNKRKNNKGINRYKKGYSINIIAKEYGVSTTTIIENLKRL